MVLTACPREWYTSSGKARLNGFGLMQQQLARAAFLASDRANGGGHMQECEMMQVSLEGGGDDGCMAGLEGLSQRIVDCLLQRLGAS